MSNERLPALTLFSLTTALLVGAAAMAMPAGPAAAAEPNCQTMIRSFDRTTVKGSTAAKASEAKKHRKAGAAALAKGNEKACLKHLQQAQAAVSHAQGTMAVDEADAAQ
jgi:hypothetical protein